MSCLRCFLFFGLLVILIGCSGRQPGMVSLPPPKVTIAVPIRRQIVDYDEFTGEIKAVKKVEVRARVSGYLKNIFFEDGQEVKAGDDLFEIDPRPYKAAYDEKEAQIKYSEAKLKLAEAELKRNERLLRSNSVSREDYEKTVAAQAEAAASVNLSKASTEQARLDLDWTKVTAEIAGRISRPFETEGNLVNASPTGATVLTRIVSVDPVYVYFNIDQRTMLRYRQDLIKDAKKTDQPKTLKEAKFPLDVGLAGELGYPHPGLIDFADNVVNPGTGMIQVRGVVPNPGKRGERLFTPGLFARVRVPVSDPFEGVLVADRAVGTDQQTKYILVVNEKNTVERRDVELGRQTTDGLRVIRSGLKADEWVIVDGVQSVRAGMTVTPEKIKMPVLPVETNPNPKSKEKTPEPVPKKKEPDKKGIEPKKEKTGK